MPGHGTTAGPTRLTSSACGSTLPSERLYLEARMGGTPFARVFSLWTNKVAALPAGTGLQNSLRPSVTSLRVRDARVCRQQDFLQIFQGDRTLTQCAVVKF